MRPLNSFVASLILFCYLAVSLSVRFSERFELDFLFSSGCTGLSSLLPVPFIFFDHPLRNLSVPFVSIPIIIFFGVSSETFPFFERQSPPIFFLHQLECVDVWDFNCPFSCTASLLWILFRQPCFRTLSTLIFFIVLLRDSSRLVLTVRVL